MRVMLKVSIPVEAGNKGVISGGLPRTVMGFVERAKPEACYFTTENGQRTMFFFVDLKEPSDMPLLAEPFFTELNAGVDWSPVMNLADMRAGVERANANK